MQQIVSLAGKNGHENVNGNLPQKFHSEMEDCRLQNALIGEKFKVFTINL